MRLNILFSHVIYNYIFLILKTLVVCVQILFNNYNQ